MKHIQTYEKFNTLSNKDLDQLNEGWKEWLAAGLITLSSIAGVYKLNKDSEDSIMKKSSYSTELCKTLDKMDKKDVKDMMDIGVKTGSPLNPEFHEFKGSKYADYSDTLSSVKKKIQENPYSYGISKDGKVVPLSK
jgi:hypothetical protein